MKKKDIDAAQNATAEAIAAQVQRTLSVMRIKGWTFPAECDVAVRVIDATALVVQITARMDDVVVERENISTATPADDIERVTDALVAEWLHRHGTKKADKAAEPQ